MVQKVKKEAPSPLKAESKVKALKAKKAALKGVHSHKKRKSSHLHSHCPRNCVSKGTFRRNKVDHNAILKFPLTYQVNHQKDRDAFVFIVGVKASKHQIKQAVKKLYDIVSPVEEKKVYDALDVAKK